jgi:mobilization protein NikA
MSSDPRPEPPPAYSGAGPGEAGPIPPPKRNRRGSERRQRDRIIGVRCRQPEAAIIEANASAVDLCPSAFLRSLGTGRQRSHERRRPLPELQPFTRALGKLGIHTSNAHQLLKLANRGEIPDVEELRETHQKLNTAADELLAIIRDYSGDR